jgi:predicted glutamine amidotransferase
VCGVAGFVRTGENTVSTWPAVKRTFEEIQSRGRDAAGFASLTDEGVWLDKAPVPSRSFVKRPVVKKYFTVGEMTIFHARYATHGNPKNNKTNHPFWTEDGRYVLVHNGVIKDNPESISMPNGVDSEIALGMIAKHGIVEAAERMSSWKKSTYTILVIDTHESALYAFRNAGRPLVFANMYETLGGYLLASTKEILTASLRKAGVEGTVTGTLPYSIYKFTAGERDIQPTRLKCFDKWLEVATAPKVAPPVAGDAFDPWWHLRSDKIQPLLVPADPWQRRPDAERIYWEQKGKSGYKPTRYAKGKQLA